MSAQSILEQTEIQTSPISCLDIGLQASSRGNFQLARRMLHVAIRQLDDSKDKQPRLIELIINIADTYLSEGNYDLAKNWYMKALHRSELLYGTNTLPTACLMAKLAEVHVLQSDLTEFQKYFDNLQRFYLFTREGDLSVLLGPLTDLSWALCIKNHIAEVKPVNSLIAQIKQTQEEDRIAALMP